MKTNKQNNAVTFYSPAGGTVCCREFKSSPAGATQSVLPRTPLFLRAASYTAIHGKSTLCGKCEILSI